MWPNCNTLPALLTMSGRAYRNAEQADEISGIRHRDFCAYRSTKVEITARVGDLLRTGCLALSDNRARCSLSFQLERLGFHLLRRGSDNALSTCFMAKPPATASPCNTTIKIGNQICCWNE